MLNKNVFSFPLKVSTELQFLSSSGSEFQSFGADKEKALSAVLLSALDVILGTVRRKLIALIFSEEAYFTKHSKYTYTLVFVTLLETGTHMLMKGKCKQIPAYTKK